MWESEESKRITHPIYRHDVEFIAIDPEYYEEYGTANGVIDVNEFINNPFINCEERIA